jgi:hypothetical protein
VLYWLRQAGVLLMIVIAAQAYTNLQETPAALRSMYRQLWPRWSEALLEWRTERAGETLLAAKVQSMLALLRDNESKTFRFSPGIAAEPDPSVVQRLAEGAYPIRYSQDAKDLLLLANEPVDPRCAIVARKLEVVLARCS